MASQYQLYDLEVKSVRRLPHACGRHEIQWTYAHCSYLGRPWGACLAGVAIEGIAAQAAEAEACRRCYLELCLFEQVADANGPQQLNRWLGMQLWPRPEGTAQRLLEPAEWPWPVPPDARNAAMGRLESLASPRLAEYWSLAAFLIQNEPSLQSQLRPQAEAADQPEQAPDEASDTTGRQPNSAPADEHEDVSETFLCAECGEEHAGLVTAYRLRFPDLWFTVPREQWRERVWLNGPLCSIDAHRFIQGTLCVPIELHDEQIEVEVWVEVARQDYEQALSLWGTDEWAAGPPYEGTLANAITGYQPTTLHLPCRLRPSLPGQPVLVQTAALDHELSLDQRLGAPVARLRAMAQR